MKSFVLLVTCSLFVCLLYFVLYDRFWGIIVVVGYDVKTILDTKNAGLV